MTYDSATWGAFALVLSGVGAVLTWFAFRHRGLGSGLRAAAVTLLPIAAWLTGTLKLAFQIGQAVGTWAVRLVFNPTVWLGIALAGVSVTLWVIGTMLRGRTMAKVQAAPREGALPRSQRAPADETGDGLEEFDDVAAILRKHGIS